MTLLDYLREKRDVIIQEWADRIYQTYPLETVGFMRRNPDPFTNPVAIRTMEAVRTMTGELLGDSLESDVVRPAVDDLIRIRSVQDFTPAQAVAVVYFVKTILRELLAKEKKLETYSPELLSLESKVDSLALLAMDIYTQCRDQIYQLRVKEIKKQYSQVMRLAKLTCDLTAEEPDLKGIDFSQQQER